MIPQERYTLILQHEYIDPDGQHHSLDEPITVSYAVVHMDGISAPSSAIVINDMMERLRMYMVERAKE